MLGILACGGLGSRLGLFTKRVSNKHLALVYDKPMIMYPIQNLVDIAVIVTGKQIGRAHV